MSCDFTYSPTGRAGIGVIQPQSGLDYPLVQPSDDIRYLLADFYLAFDDAGEYGSTPAPSKPPFRIQYLYRVGCAAGTPPAGAPEPRNETDADIVVVDGAGTVIFDSTAGVSDYRDADWNTDYKIYEWRTTAGVCRLVAHTTWTQTDGDARQYATYLAPNNAVLDPRAVYKMPRRVLSLSVRQSSGPVALGPYRGKFVFRNGYNTLLAAGETTVDNFVVNTDINFSAEAGTGQGYYPICGDVVDEETNENIPQPIITINGINGTPDGNFLLVGNDCIYVRRPTAETEACVTYVDQTTGETLTACATKATPLPYIDLQMGTDCPPCCECGDYVKTALYMNTVYDNYKKISDYTTAIKNTHEENIRRWAERAGCASANPLKLALVPQNCPYLDVVAMICYPCDDCLPESRLSLTLTPGGLNPTLVCGYTELVGAGKNKSAEISIDSSDTASTKLSFDMPVINSGGSAYLKFRLKFGEPLPETLTGKLTGKLKAVIEDGDIVVEGGDIKTGCSNSPPYSREKAEAVVVTKLNCTDAGETIRPC